MFNEYFNLLRYKVEIFRLKKGFAVTIQKPMSPREQFAPLTEAFKSLKEDGENWKNAQEQEPEEDAKIKQGMYFFETAEELTRFLMDLFI